MRIVALSDQHGHLPRIPQCDLLLIAGDICPDGIGPYSARHYPMYQAAWFDRTIRPWLAESPATYKIATWGNHDWCGMAYPFRDDQPEVAPAERLQLLVDTGTRVPTRRQSDESAATPLTIWGTPWSNQFLDWAFMKPPAELANVYASIPDDVDILLSHQPPYGYGDQVYDPVRERFNHRGSHELVSAIDRINPRLVVCGHIHSGHGRYLHNGIPIYNVSVADDLYRLVNAPTVTDLP